MHTLGIAPLRSESPSQKRSGTARVLKGFHSFTCTPTSILVPVSRYQNVSILDFVGANDHGADGDITK